MVQRTFETNLNISFSLGDVITKNAIKRVYFLQKANNLNVKLFFSFYTWPTKQVFCLY